MDGNKAKILAERGFSKTFGELDFNTDIPVMKHVLSTKQPFFAGDIQSSPAADYVLHVCSINSVICAPSL